MAIQDDFTIDYVDRKITYTTAFVNDRPPFIYTVNELYSFLQDTFDEPSQMDDPVPMSAQTPTQYTIINKWFIDDESMKALYGGSIQTTGWSKSGSEGITQLRWQDTLPGLGEREADWEDNLCPNGHRRDIRKDKQASADLATRMLGVRDPWRLKKHDGVAEAALLAMWLLDQHQR